MCALSLSKGAMGADKSLHPLRLVCERRIAGLCAWYVGVALPHYAPLRFNINFYSPPNRAS